MGAIKGLLVLAALAALAAGWMLKGELLPQGLRSAAEELRDAVPKPGAAQKATAAVRKCVSAGGELLYSTEACPVGTREQAVQGGTVNVLSAAPRPAASAASAQPLLRQLSDPEEIERLRERRMQLATGGS